MFTFLIFSINLILYDLQKEFFTVFFWIYRTMLHFLDSRKFNDANEFLEKFGNLKTTEQVASLHEVLAPYMLRRMKEDVDKTLPLKEETIVTVELSNVQKKYYRAILEKNRGFLYKGIAASSNLPSLNNIMMELRKCCNHPFLIAGAEDAIVFEAQQKHGSESADDVAQRCRILASSKFVLMDKLLAKLREEKHKVKKHNNDDSISVLYIFFSYVIYAFFFALSRMEKKWNKTSQFVFICLFRF
jgi:SNF2 family DNA or RNA helicase